MSVKVFISYSHKDKALVNQIVNDLQTRCTNLSIWIDIVVRPGESIINFIEEGIQRCDYFIIALSKAAVTSRWVREELHAAKVKEIENQGVFIIPILLERCDIPPLLLGKKYIDFTKSYEEGIHELITFFKYEDQINAPIERRILASVDELHQLPKQMPERTRDYYFLREGVVRISAEDVVHVSIKRNDGTVQTVRIKKPLHYDS